ncbi:uncharacterized protein LOC134815005 isoform X1 [Bolinopsis microptera]|uniref:uncharacterized protein LOC134815005 isoform X1 n=1 Tax=Bolinopsis microptera TaxID=2820187 RepID=UPI0030794060
MSYGYCYQGNEYYDFMTANCPMTCGVCEVEAEEEGWISPQLQQSYSLELSQTLELKTTMNQVEAPITVYFIFPEDETQYINFKCTDLNSSRWILVIQQCMPDSWDAAQPLNGVSSDHIKVWRITRTETSLLVECNGVTVLIFNFASDYKEGFSSCHSFWTRHSTAIKFNWSGGLYKNNGHLSMRTAVNKGMRELLVGQVFPVRSEHSRTREDNEEYYGAANAVDQKLGTRSWTEADSDGGVWLKLTLGQVTCVQQIVWYFTTGNPILTYSCSNTDCTCEGKTEWCASFSLTVYNLGSEDTIPPVSGCIYGDTVKIHASYLDFYVYEILITEKKGMRELLVGEVFPVSAEHSRTNEDNEEYYDATKAVDQNMGTRSWTEADSDGGIWLKLTLGQVTCVQQIVWYLYDSSLYQTWSCSNTDCTCEGEVCNYYTLAVYNEGAVDNIPPVSGCIYGDTVKLLKTNDNIGSFFVYEISITEKKGMRPILVGEVFPVSVEHSRTKHDNEEENGAHLAIDLNLLTISKTYPGADGSTWFKVTLDQVSCVHQVVTYFDGRPHLIWTCSNTDCSCEGYWCSSFSLTVYNEGAVDNVPSVSSCKYGNTVKLQRDKNNLMEEISITEKKVGPQGEQGAEGEQGNQGATGRKGAQGTNDFCSSVGWICSLEGAEGEPGEDGADGENGPTGDSGDVGAKGEMGREGTPGFPGLSGVKGIKGGRGIDGQDSFPGWNGQQNCGSESCSLRLGPCYGMGSSRFTVKCMEGYAANGIWRNSRFWGLRCCKIVVK